MKTLRVILLLKLKHATLFWVLCIKFSLQEIKNSSIESQWTILHPLWMYYEFLSNSFKQIASYYKATVPMSFQTVSAQFSDTSVSYFPLSLCQKLRNFKLRQFILRRHNTERWREKWALHHLLRLVAAVRSTALASKYPIYSSRPRLLQEKPLWPPSCHLTQRFFRSL